jgi:hypothetical protein
MATPTATIGNASASTLMQAIKITATMPTRNNIGIKTAKLLVLSPPQKKKGKVARETSPLFTLKAFGSAKTKPLVG